MPGCCADCCHPPDARAKGTLFLRTGFFKLHDHGCSLTADVRSHGVPEWLLVAIAAGACLFPFRVQRPLVLMWANPVGCLLVRS